MHRLLIVTTLKCNLPMSLHYPTGTLLIVAHYWILDTTMVLSGCGGLVLSIS